VQSTFITGSAAFMWLHAISRLKEPHEIHQTQIGIIVMVISLILTYGLIALQRYVVKRTHNAAIDADSTHYFADGLVNISVIVVLLLNPYLWQGADAVLGILISLYIFYSAFRIAHQSSQALLDHELPRNLRQQIIDIVEAHPKVRGLHELRTREAGHMQFIQLHIDLDKAIDLQQAHDIADDVEAAVLKAFPNADVLIHPDPV